MGELQGVSAAMEDAGIQALVKILFAVGRITRCGQDDLDYRIIGEGREQGDVPWTGGKPVESLPYQAAKGIGKVDGVVVPCRQLGGLEGVSLCQFLGKQWVTPTEILDGSEP